MTRYALVYDVVLNSRRSRFHKKLKRLMVPVQKSVFEGELDARALAEVEALIERHLDPATDQVRLYPLCAACEGRIRVYGASPSVIYADSTIIV